MCFPPLYVHPITPEYIAKLQRAKRPASVSFPGGNAGVAKPAPRWRFTLAVFILAAAIGFGVTQCTEPEPVLCFNTLTKGTTA